MKAIGKETVSVSFNTEAQLTPPAGARFAVIVCEPDGSSTNATKAVRYWINNSSPTPSEGLHLGATRHTATLGGPHALSTVRFVGVESGKTHLLQVQYWR